MRPSRSLTAYPAAFAAVLSGPRALPLIDFSVIPAPDPPGALP